MRPPAPLSIAASPLHGARSLLADLPEDSLSWSLSPSGRLAVRGGAPQSDELAAALRACAQRIAGDAGLECRVEWDLEARTLTAFLMEFEGGPARSL